MQIDTGELDRNKEQLERFTTLAKTSKSALVTWSVEKGVHASDCWESMTGWGKDIFPQLLEPVSADIMKEAIEDWLEIVHPEDRARARAIMVDYFILNKCGEYENMYRLEKKDGEYIQVISNGVAYRHDKKIVAIAMTYKAVPDLSSKVRFLEKSLSVATERADKATKTATKAVEETAKVRKDFKTRLRNLTILLPIFATLIVSLGDLFHSSLLQIQRIRKSMREVEVRPNKSHVDRIPAVNKRQKQITDVLLKYLDYGDHVYLANYAPVGFPEKGHILLQVKSANRNWLQEDWSLSAERVQEERAEEHLSLQPSETWKNNGKYIEYSIPGKIPDSSGLIFYVAIILPSDASEGRKEAARKAVESLRDEVQEYL